jgi:enoyl-CoA hydratase/carnithine racemase
VRQEKALATLIHAFSTTPAPLAVVAQGRASGAGAMLLAMADVVLAAPSLQISAPEMRFGMYPVIVEAVLQSRMSPALCTQLCMGGRSLDLRAAFEAGLVTETLSDLDPENQAQARIDFYLKRATGLRVARRARITSLATRALLARLPQVSPLMIENHAHEDVRARIARYLADLRSRHACRVGP